MANNMVFKAQRLTVNAVGVGGLVDVAVNPKFVAVSRPTIDDLIGPGYADRSVHSIDGTVGFEDGGSKLVTLLGTAPTSAGLVFFTQESGAATYTKHEIGANANTQMLVHGGSFVSRFDQVARCTAQFAVRHNTAAMTWAESWKQTRGVLVGALPARTEPVRIGPMTAVTANGLTPATLVGLSYNVAGVLARTGAGDFSGEVVDIIGYNVTGALTFKDHDTASSFAYQLLTAARGDIVATFREHGATDSEVLTLKNVSFEPQVNQTYSAVGGHAEFSVPFSCGFDATVDTLAELIAWVD